MSKNLFSRPSAIARTVVVCVVAAVAIGPVASPKSSLAQEKRDDSSDAKVELSDFGEAAGDPGAIREVPPKRDELEQLLGKADKERLTYSPDKKLLVHLDGRLVTVWSVEERRQLHRFVLDGRPLAAAFSPDGGSLVTADGEGNLEYRSTVRLWSLATGEGRLSKSGQETILDSKTGKPLQPTSRGEQDGADQPAPAPEPKSEGKTALGNMALEFDTPASQKAGKGAIAPTGLTIVVCDSANNVLDTLVVPRDIKNGDFEFIVPKGIDEIRVFALGKRIVGIGGPGAILNPMLREMISEGLTKNYFVAGSKERGGIGLVMAEIREGVLNGMSAAGAPIPLRVTGKMQKQIREDIAEGKRAPIIYRHETDESGSGFIRVLAD